MSERLIENEVAFLRHITREDRDEVCALRELSREFHQPWEPVSDNAWAGDAWFERFVDQADSASNQKHLICRQGDGAAVGYVGLGQIFMGPFCSCFMGYWVGLPHVRLGYASAGIALCLERAFTSLGLHRVEANIIPENAASLALVRRCGMTREGYSRRYLKIGGTWRDHERWAVTFEDWETAQKG